MSVIRLIRSVPGRESLTAEQVRDYLYTPDPKKRSEAQATYSTLGLITVFAETEENATLLVETMIGTMRAAGLNETANALAAKGIDFSRPEIPPLLALLAQDNAETFTEPRIATLLNLGTDSRTPAQRQGFADELTLQEIETAIEAEATDTWFNAKVDDIRDLIHSGDVVSQADVIAAMEGK